MKKVAKITDTVNNTKRATSTREFLRAKAESYTGNEADEMAAAFSLQTRTQNDRRITSASFGALAVLTAELSLKDKSKVLLMALVGLSEGHRAFQTTYERIYLHLRKYDPKLRDVDGRLNEKAQQTVRHYIDALRTDQELRGITCARITPGRMDGETRIPTSVEMQVLEFLDEINQRAKANPSYSKSSRSIREREARKFAAELLSATIAPTLKQQCETRRERQRKIKRMLRQANGLLDSAIAELQAEGYTDEGKRKTLLNELLKARQQDQKAFLETITLLAELPIEIIGLLEKLKALLSPTNEENPPGA